MILHDNRKFKMLTYDYAAIDYNWMLEFLYCFNHETDNLHIHMEYTFLLSDLIDLVDYDMRIILLWVLYKSTGKRSDKTDYAAYTWWKNQFHKQLIELKVESYTTQNTDHLELIFLDICKSISVTWSVVRRQDIKLPIIGNPGLTKQARENPSYLHPRRVNAKLRT